MVKRSGRARRVASVAAIAASTAYAAPSNNQFEIVGNSGVSAQQLFLANANKVVIVDKVEGNGNDLNINGHPAWATEYDINTNTYRAMDVVTNSFCAGGNVAGDGTWLNVGGNQPVGPGGLNAEANAAPYGNGDGGRAVRTFRACDDGNCDWNDTEGAMTTRRWYPTLETLEDGSIIIDGGCDYGGYVNDAGQNNPTFEYWPSRGAPIGLNLLVSTLPANLFPLIWLLPSGNLFINANLGNEIFDYKNNQERMLPNTPHAVRTYPGSAATALLPLTPANNYTATILMCGGTNLQPDQWVTTWNIAAYPADQTCISITPDVSGTWQDEDMMMEPRVMGQFINLPDGRLLLLNGQASGTAGYGNTSWAIGQSFGNNPIYAPAYYDPSRPRGSRFNRDGMGDSTVARMYHSAATLLPDGSVFVSGSNPNADFISAGTPGYPFPTEYRVERFYPDYYLNPRPEPTGIPANLTYGGNYFDVQLPAASVGDSSNLAQTTVVVIRTGFSTHAMNMGQRMLQLQNTATANPDGSATLHVAQLPRNAALFAPGPAFIFVVVNGTPSMGQEVMIGNGRIGDQPLQPDQALPASSGFGPGASTSGSAASPTDTSRNAQANAKSAATRETATLVSMLSAALVVALVAGISA